MSVIERRVFTSDDGYQEVSLSYRVARAARLETPGDGRIACPMLDASRSKVAYQQLALPGTRGRDLKVWADAIHANSLGIKIVAYLSGPFWGIPFDFLRRRFNDRKVNSGFIRSLKHGINTGILAQGHFDQSMLDAFVWAVHPELKGTPITNDWVHSESASGVYVDRSMMPAIRAHNRSNAHPGRVGRGLGLWLSTFEMETLLLGVLAQPVALDGPDHASKENAILVRDVHDLYKYGYIPALAEERLHAAGLLQFPPVHAHPS